MAERSIFCEVMIDKKKKLKHKNIEQDNVKIGN